MFRSLSVLVVSAAVAGLVGCGSGTGQQPKASSSNPNLKEPPPPGQPGGGGKARPAGGTGAQ
jgi:hypothetical protein